jgi:uncharacterized protein (DUF169 family)
MVDVKTADRELQTYIRPQTFPVAIRMLRPGEPIPERAKRPARDFKKLSMNCQVIDMARRYGWMIALTREDHICSLGIAALGFEKPTHLHASGTLCEGMYTETKEAGQRSEAAVDRFAPGEYHALLVAPLDRTTFEPDLVCIYANPAQVMRLTQAALWKRGGKLASSFGGRIDCSEIIVTTMRTDQPQVILPCSGDRIFGQTQDHEMAFTIPWGQMDEIIEGLRGTTTAASAIPSPSSWSTRPSCRRSTWRPIASGTPRRARPATATATGWWRPTSARSPTGCRSIRSWPPCRHARRAVDRVLHESHARHHGDDELLRALPARRGARLQRPGQGGGGLRLPREVLRLRRPSIDAHVLHEDKSLLARLPMPDPYKTGRLPGFLEQCEALVKASRRRPSARWRWPWTIAMLLRNPETMLLDTFEDPQFIHDVMRVATGFSKIWATPSSRRASGSAFPSRRPRSA